MKKSADLISHRAGIATALCLSFLSTLHCGAGAATRLAVGAAFVEMISKTFE